MNYTEIELKFSAEDISLTDFHTFCKSRNPVKFLTPSGWDHFYSNKAEPDSFCRLRSGLDMHQLTFKKKSEARNNFIRREYNVDLARTMTRTEIEAFIEDLGGYEYNNSIFKTCFIYTYDLYTLVYYTVYDLEMYELGRYVEIEMKEDHAWGPDEAWNYLMVLEKLSKPLGISPQGRIKRSLFELYRKAA